MLGFTLLSSSMTALTDDETGGSDDDPDVEEDGADDGSVVGDVVVLFAVDTLEALLPVADRTLFSSDPIDSSLCHLELRAELICVHSSFLHDFDLLMDCNQSLNCALPSGVIWNALRADRMVLVNSS